MGKGMRSDFMCLRRRNYSVNDVGSIKKRGFPCVREGIMAEPTIGIPAISRLQDVVVIIGSVSGTASKKQVPYDGPRSLDSTGVQQAQ
jgi:hypothetical protein